MRRLALAVATAAAAALLATAAQAGIDAGSTTGADTHFTPTPKDPPGKLFKQVAGAVYDEKAPSKPKPLAGGSVTTTEADLFDVAFLDEDHGFAVGAECPVPEKHAKDCPEDTRPAVYAYEGQGGVGEWRRDDLSATGPGFAAAIAWLGKDRAIAVGGSGTYPEREAPGANCTEGGDPDSDPAGKGRVWTYEKDTGWRQLEATELPEDLRALHAADAYIPLQDPKIEFAALGGLCQLWHWRDGGFQKQDDGSLEEPFSPTAEDPGRLIPELTHRVRDVRFGRLAHQSPALQPSDQQIEAIAVTAGCCATSDQERLQPKPVTLTLTPPNDARGNPDRSTDLALWRWSAKQDQSSPSEPGSYVAATATRVGRPGHYVPGGSFAEPRWVDESPLRTSAIATALGAPPNDETEAALEPSSTIAGEKTATTTSLRLYDGAGDIAGGEVFSSQGVVRVTGENPTNNSTVTGRACPGSDPNAPQDIDISLGPRDPAIAIVPGQFGVPTPTYCSAKTPASKFESPAPPPDGVPDWTVGELEGGRGAVYTTLAAMSPGHAIGDTESYDICPYGENERSYIGLGIIFGTEGPNEVSGKHSAQAECTTGRTTDYAGAFADYYGKNSSNVSRSVEPSTRSYRLLKSGTYALNAIEVLDKDAVGWMVGDRGAIVRLQLAEERKPAKAEEGRDEELPATAPPSQSSWPEPDEGEETGPSAIPPYDQAERSEAAVVPELKVAGSVREAPTSIVMSRDGSEGWAFASKGAYHYDGRAWRDCASYESDRACATYIERIKPKGNVISATRVPLERDDDPANDDELAIVGITGERMGSPNNVDNTDFAPRPTAVARYSNGAWSFEDSDRAPRMPPSVVGAVPGCNTTDCQSLNHARFTDVEFVAPDDGWALASAGLKVNGNVGKNLNVLFRFDGESWISCARGARRIQPAGPGGGGATESFVPIEERRCGSDRARLPFDDLIDGDVQGLVAAGSRLYAYGSRKVTPPKVDFIVSTTSVASHHPFVIFREPGTEGWSKGQSEPVVGEYDPGWSLKSGGAGAETAKAARGQLPGEGNKITGLMVHERPGGGYEGWATGAFGERKNTGSVFEDPIAEAHLLRLDGSGDWELVRDAGALGDVPLGGGRITASERSMAMTEGQDGGLNAFVGVAGELFSGREGNVYELNRTTERWQAVPSARPLNRGDTLLPAGGIEAVAPDGEGGLWASIAATGTGSGQIGRDYLYRVTSRPAKDVFTETPLPSHVPLAITAIAAVPATGATWLTTGADSLYRYDRRGGWDRVRIPGWDPPRVTATSPANAIAVGPEGTGLVVGKGGRIASFSEQAVRMERASRRPCGAMPATPPCTTPEHLRSVAIAPDGAAVIGAEGARVLWRPPSGEIREIEGPDIKRNRAFTSAEVAHQGLVWLVSAGEIYRGERTAEQWRWSLESSEGASAIELDEKGRGYAVGPKGLVMERSAEAGNPAAGTWQKLKADTTEDLTSVAMAPGDPETAIAGGGEGVILTRVGDRFEVARPADFPAGGIYGYPNGGTASILGLTLIPGPGGRGLEAWALRDGVGAGGSHRLYHFPGNATGSLSLASARAPALPDSPPAKDGEIAFGAFGKTGCRTTEHLCRGANAGMKGSNEYAELIATRIASELVGESRSRGGALVSLFTGDGVDSGGYPGAQAQENVAGTDTVRGVFSDLEGFGSRKLRRFAEQVPDRLAGLGVPMFGAVGVSDLPSLNYCEAFFTGLCASSQAVVDAGDNLAWRQAMAGQPAPWGKARRAPGRYRYRRVADPLAIELSDSDTPGLDGVTRARRVPAGGAHTHYALDVLDRASRPARIVVVDTSLRSLASSDPIQNPQQPRGGQAEWLERMLCIADNSAAKARGCTRKPGQRAVVLSNAPTYSYGPGASETALDGAAIETVLVKNRADAFVSGRIGWNGLYWTTLPGVHHPCPGGEYPDGAPRGIELCGQGTPAAVPAPGEALSQALSATSAGPAAELVGGGLKVGGAIPFVVASGGGGELAEEVGQAKDGFWNGYSLIRLDPSGDPAKTIVEQRPIYDWVGIEAQERTLRPGQKMPLRGFARGPLGMELRGLDNGDPRRQIVRLDRIDGPAVTHRYELLAADPQRPWRAKAGPDGKPEPLDPSVATIDAQSGLVRAGRGNHPRAYAVAVLSVGKHSAGYPIVFEPRRTFQPKASASPARTATVTVQSAQAGIAPPASPGTPPQVGSVSPPALPAFPSVTPPAATPPLGAPHPAPPPPAPPAPPPPAALELAPAPPGLTVAPPASVIPPPAPPINPAPPGGARKEARQRQAATEKSGSDAGSQGSQDEAQVDIADKPFTPHGADMTRRDRVKASPSFTAVSRTEQPSAWARGALYGGGVTLAALTMALGWSTARPRPRRRPPEAPVPAWVTRSRH